MSSPTELPILVLNNTEKQQKILNILKNVIIDEEKQNKIRIAFLSEMTLGLAGLPSSIQMVNTFVEHMFNGTEEGNYLALDLGSTNFRVILINLREGKIIGETVDYFEVPTDKRHGSGEAMFDFLAKCIEEFLAERNLIKTSFDLGFTFSFPTYQLDINKSLLKTWTKNFTCSGVVGEDVAKMLDVAMKKRNLKINVVAVLNDTTGTLVQGSYMDKNCAIGLILGTGNNGCYIEKAKNIPKWKGHEEEEVIINMEWGSFGDNGVLDFIRTKWDEAVDAQSLFKKSFTFEKYIGGKFLGDLIRESLLSLVQEGLFASHSSELQTQGSLLTSIVSEIEREAFQGGKLKSEETLRSLNVAFDEDDISTLQYVCGIFSYRGILLVSLICSLLLSRMNRKHCTIAIDGSLYENHPRYKLLLHHLISNFSPSQPFSLLLSKDGSGKGAGLVAAVESRHKKEKSDK